jgi:hypothetical protein
MTEAVAPPEAYLSINGTMYYVTLVGGTLAWCRGPSVCRGGCVFFRCAHIGEGQLFRGRDTSGLALRSWYALASLLICLLLSLSSH